MTTTTTIPTESAFATVLADWTRLRAARRNEIGDWNRAMEVAIQEESELRARGAWVHGREDLFGVVGIQRAEIRHSAMIAWLLDPCARHGLGTRFLAAILERAFPRRTFTGQPGARTTCEVARGDCRADIVLEMPDAMIIIENKVDAIESPRQCDILFERFSENGTSLFVLLTPTGKRPETATGEAAEAFMCLSYLDVCDALIDALGAARAEPAPWGRRLAEDYLCTLRREFR